MLVLTRKRDEEIRIGSDIVIRVMKTARGSVKIGIEAPKDVRVVRGEIATENGADPIGDQFPFALSHFEECSSESLLVQN